MIDGVYCYHCRCLHPEAEMRRFVSNGRQRWRCRRSLAGAKGSRAQRDAFGLAVSAMNRSSEERLPLPHCVGELLSKREARDERA